MHKTVKTILATSLIAAAPAVFAATQGDDTKPAPTDNTGQMMQDKGQMDHGMSMKEGEMPMMKMMAQMNEMMATCNKMMKSKMKESADPKSSADKS